MNPLLLPVASNLAMALVNLYAQNHAATAQGDIAKASVVIGLIGNVSAAISQVNATLQQAHVEGWTATDSRWDPVFAAADAAQQAALARLT